MAFLPAFTQTLIHSLWQSAALYIFGVSLGSMLRRLHPLEKRNLFYLLAFGQVTLSAFTFFLLFTAKTGIGFSLRSVLERFDFTEIASPFLFFAWAVIVISKSVRIIVAQIVFRKAYIKDQIRPTAENRIFTAITAARLGIKKTVNLVYSKSVNSAFTTGFLKPMIVLPFNIISCLSAAEIESIIMHELAHIRSNDFILNRFLVFAEAGFFFNPFFKLISAKIRSEREKNCDVEVMNFQHNPAVYAAALLKLARFSPRKDYPVLSAVRRSSEVLQRMLFFSSVAETKFSRFKAGLFTLPVLAIVVFLSMQTILPEPATKATETITAGTTTATSFSETSNTTVKTIGLKARPPEKIQGKVVKPARIESIPDDVEINLIASEPAFADVSLTPVSFQQFADTVKEFTYKVETSRGSVTQQFRVAFRKGKWIAEPLWMITEKTADSLMRMRYDSLQ